LFRAGRQAAARSAYPEAVIRLSSALDLLKQLPDDAERKRQELSIQSIFGLSLSNAKGLGAAELEPVYARVRELCAQIHDPARAFRALFGQWLMRYWNLELDKALELADQLLAAAEDVGDPAMLLRGNYARGAILISLGELVSANEHLEKALTAFDLRQPLRAELEAIRVTSFTYLYYGLYNLGYPDRAWAKSDQMVEVAQRSSEPFTLAQASCFLTLHQLLRGDSVAAQECAERGTVLAEETGIASLSADAIVRHGAALIAQGRYEEGIAGIRRGISAWRSTGGTPFAWIFCLLASGLGKIGRPEEGLQVVEEAFAFVARTGEQINSGWLNRVKGELLLLQNPSDTTEAERRFRTAIEIARRQSARSPELRATTSLARLLRDTNRCDEARKMLAAIYNWFTEGFDTADLKEAKALLGELSA
jgi:predicted ATPase